MNNYIVSSKIVNLSSRNCVSKNGSKNSQLYFSFPMLHKQKNIVFNTISVLHAEIPISWYAVNDNNNFFSSSLGNVTLTKGNYNANSFMNMFNSVNALGFTLSFSSSSAKFTLTHSTSDFTIFMATTCNEILGMERLTNYVSSSKSLIFPYLANFLGITRITIKSDIITTDNIDSDRNGHSAILSSIPVNNGMGGMVLYNNVSNFKNLIDNFDMNYLDISFYDQNDNLIDFNGVHLHLTLQIDSYLEYIPEKTDLATLYPEK